MQHHHEDVTLHAMLPSCPSHCHRVWVVFWALTGYRSEVNRLRTITNIVGQKLNIEYTRTTNVWLYQVETALLVDQSDSGQCLAAIAWASCCLFTVGGTITGLDWTTGLLGWTTGLDYWTHPNCKIHVVQCRIEAKHRYLFLSYFANTAP